MIQIVKNITNSPNPKMPLQFFQKAIFPIKKKTLQLVHIQGNKKKNPMSSTRQEREKSQDLK